MFGRNFLFKVSEDFLSNCQIPLLVLMGRDIYHPEVTPRRVVELAPRATLLEHWQDPKGVDNAGATINSFLAEHTYPHHAGGCFRVLRWFNLFE